jgi:predicted small lipoprotein YifL
MRQGYRLWGKDTRSSPLPQLGGGGKHSVRGSRLSRTILLVLLGALALAPAACGRKGAPILPPGQTDQFPHQYPKSTDPQQGVFN